LVAAELFDIRERRFDKRLNAMQQEDTAIKTVLLLHNWQVRENNLFFIEGVCMGVNFHGSFQ
jgi:hypothetical protein